MWREGADEEAGHEGVKSFGLTRADARWERKELLRAGQLGERDRQRWSMGMEACCEMSETMVAAKSGWRGTRWRVADGDQRVSPPVGAGTDFERGERAHRISSTCVYLWYVV